MPSSDGPGAFPVEPARAVLREPEPPARRHRWLTAPSGVIVFVCLFLPAVRICGSPAYPYEAFGVQTPYLLGLLAAIAALVRRPRALAGLVIAMRVVLWLTVVGWFVAFVVMAGDPRHHEVLPLLVWVPVSAVFVLVFGWRSRDERAAARATIGAAIGGIVWFGLFCFDPGAMYGTYTGAVASVGMLVGGLGWWREVGRSPRIPASDAVYSSR